MNWSVGAALLVVRFISGLLISTAMCCAQFQLSEPTIESDEESTTRESGAGVVLELERVETRESAADGPDSDDASDLIDAPRRRVRFSGVPAGPVSRELIGASRGQQKQPKSGRVSFI